MAEKSLGELEVKLSADINNLSKGIDSALNELKAFAKKVDETSKTGSSAWQKFGSNLEQAKFIFAGIAGGMTAAGIASVHAAGQMEQWRVSFETMLGSASKAETLLAKISDFAAKTPFELPGVVQGSKQLLAFGITAENVLPSMKMLGDTAAGLGVPIERLILNFGQVAAQGKLTGRELRDFAIAGVPLLDELAKSMGKTKVEIQDMVSAGQIGFPDVVRAFQSMTGEGGRFNDMMIKQSQTLFGMISNLKDNIIRLSISFGDMLLPALKKVVEMSINLTAIFTSITPETKKLVLLIGGAVAATSGVLAVMGAMIAFSGPILAFFGTIFSWIGLLILAIAGIATAIVAAKTNIFGFGDAMKTVFASLGNLWNSVKNLFSILVDFLKQGIAGVRMVIQQMAEGTYGIFNQLTLLVIGLIGKAVSASATGIGAFMSTVGSGISWVWDQIRTFGNWVIDLVWKMLPDNVKESLTKIREQMGETFEVSKTEMGKVVDKFKEDWDKMKADAIAAMDAMSGKSKQTLGEYVFENTEANEQARASTEAKFAAEEKIRMETARRNRWLWNTMGMEQESWTNQAKTLSSSFFNQFGQGMAQMIMEGKRFSDIMKQIWRNLAAEIIAMIARMIAKWLVWQAMTGGAGGMMGGGGGFFGGLWAKGGVINEPSVITGLRSGKQVIAGEAGPEAVVPMQDMGAVQQDVEAASVGGGAPVNVTVNISGQFIEGNEAAWQILIRDKIVPEIRRWTMSTPVGPFTRRRGATA